MSSLIPFFKHVVFIGQGLGLTLGLLSGSFTLGLTLGMAWALGMYHNIPGIKPCISLLRGTPVILQLSFVYFVVARWLGTPLSLTSVGIITLGLNSAAYLAEIFRSGIQSIPQGQFEAAASLGIPRYYIWKDIVLPQVIHRVFPALVNEMITLLKDTSLIATLGGLDIMRNAQIIATQSFSYFLPLGIAGGYYYILVRLIEYVSHFIEKKHARTS